MSKELKNADKNQINQKKFERGRYESGLKKIYLKPSGDRQRNPILLLFLLQMWQVKLHFRACLGHQRTRYHHQQKECKVLILYVTREDHAGICYNKAKVEAKLAEEHFTFMIRREKFIWDGLGMERRVCCSYPWGNGESWDIRWLRRERFTFRWCLSEALGKFLLRCITKIWFYRWRNILSIGIQKQKRLYQIWGNFHKDGLKELFIMMTYPLADW